MEVTVEKALPHERDILARLLEFNSYEFSQLDHRSIGADGSYGYPWLHAYWSESGRTPYLFHCEGELAGFALVSRLPDDAISMSEFLVLPKFRRAGVGTQAVARLFDIHRGTWQVSQVAGHVSATAFWRRTIAAAFVESVDDDGRIVQRFNS